MSSSAKRMALCVLAAQLVSGVDLRSQPADALEGKVPGLAVCFAPDTPPERVAEHYARARGTGTSLDPESSEFRLGSRWTVTAGSPGPLGQGAPTVITWSIVPDG